MKVTIPGLELSRFQNRVKHLSLLLRDVTEDLKIEASDSQQSEFLFENRKEGTGERERNESIPPGSWGCNRRHEIKGRFETGVGVSKA